MLIMLPPSEGKASPGRGKPLDLGAITSPELTNARADLIDALAHTCRDQPAKASKMLGLGPSQAELVGLNATLRENPTARADQIYAGVLYEALDIASLDRSARSRATRWVAVASALFGVVRLSDRIPSYRISADTTVPGLGRVSGYWRGHLAEAMPALAGAGLVLDLRSAAYAKFWKPIESNAATLRVLHDSHGQLKVVSHFNKATKGRIVNALLSEGAQPKGAAELAQVLRDLGWVVTEADPGARSGRLDVIVTEV